MTTKTITGAYPTGYYLKPAYQILDIGVAATVGGSGVTASATQASTVNNLGSVVGALYGVRLLDGGSITNGSATNTTALIEGSAIAPGGGGAGILVEGAAATVVNLATIAETALVVGAEAYYAATVELLAGGSVTNGSASNLSARIDGGVGVYVKGGVGTVVNYATIAPGLDFSAVSLEAGGSVTNGSATDTGATLFNGVQLSRGAGTLVNYGTIRQTSLSDGHGSNLAIGALFFEASGAVINGSAVDPHATISGIRGIETLGITSAPLTVTNFGTIESSGGASKFAILFDSTSPDSLVEEGTGVLVGVVTGNGGVLELGAAAGSGTIGGIGGSVTGFGVIKVDAGAGWHLTGANEIAAGISLSNAAAIIDQGVLTNEGSIALGALFQLTTGAQLVNNPGGTISISGNTPISPAAGATGTSFVNEGLLEANGSGTMIIGADLTDSGTIQTPTGTLELSGAVNTIDGALTGSSTVIEGVINFHLGATTLESGATIAGGLTLEITGAGGHLIVDTSPGVGNSIVATSQTELTIAAGVTFNAGVNFTGNTVDGAGTLQASGTISAVTLGGTLRWNNKGLLDDNGKFTIGDAAGATAVFFNEGGGIFDITGDSSIAIGAAKTSHFSNAALFEKTGGTGVSTVSVGVANAGTIAALSGTLDFAAAVSGAGAMHIGGGATLEFGGAVATGGTVTFAGADGVLQLNKAEEFMAKVAGFAAGQTIDVRGLALGADPTLTYSGASASGVLTLTNGKHVANIALLGQYAAANFATSSDGQGGVDITFVPTSASLPSLAAPGH